MQRKEKGHGRRILLKKKKKNHVLISKRRERRYKSQGFGLESNVAWIPAVDLNFLGSHCFVCAEERHCLQDGCQEETKPCVGRAWLDAQRKARMKMRPQQLQVAALIHGWAFVSQVLLMALPSVAPL